MSRDHRRLPLTRTLAIILLGWLMPACAATELSQPIVVGTSHVLESKVLGDARQINVWRPPSFRENSGPLTTVYLIDGGLDQDFQHVAGLAQLGALSWTFEPLIIVGIETKVRMSELTAAPMDERYADSFPEAGGSALFRDFIAGEVIPFIEANYGPAPRKALLGESLAGLFVAETFLTAPHLFDDYIAVSPSLWWDDQRLAGRASEHLQAHDTSSKRLYLAMADEDGTMRAGLDRWMGALKRDAPDSLRWTFDDRGETQTHATIFHPAALDAFRWLYGSPPFDYGETPWYMIEGESPPSDA